MFTQTLLEIRGEVLTEKILLDKDEKCLIDVARVTFSLSNGWEQRHLREVSGHSTAIPFPCPSQRLTAQLRGPRAPTLCLPLAPAAGEMPPVHSFTAASFPKAELAW